MLLNIKTKNLQNFINFFNIEQTMDELSRRRFSNCLFEALDQQGYSIGRIKKRSNSLSDLLEWTFASISGSREAIFGGSREAIFAGSAGEGIAKLFSSDLDGIVVYKGLVCVDEGHTEDGLLVARNEFSQTPPGYVRLQVDDSSYSFPITENWLPTSVADGKRYLDSEATKYLLKVDFDSADQFAMDSEINGPAVTSLPRYNYLFYRIPETLKNIDSIRFETDCVLGLQFYSSKILEKWLSRERYHEWPSKELQDKIGAMNGYVVPVGHKFSPNKNVEWRISYTTAEKKLVRNMNNVQVKLYVVFKFIRKERLKPVCPNFTSYMVKNLVFWVLELTPESEFTPHNLVEIIMSALRILKRFLTNNVLPCYMIPERNLLVERMNEGERKALLGVVECFIAEDYEFILKNHKLSLFMQINYSDPELAKNFALWIAEIEDLCWILFEGLHIGRHLSPFPELLINACISGLGMKELLTFVRLVLLIIPRNDFITYIRNGDMESIPRIFWNTLKNVLS